MLHIILGILKIAGIIIGSLLLFFLAILLALLLVPVRYRLRASKTEQVMETEAGVSWLFHIVSLHVSAGKGRKMSVILRLFGFRLPFFRSREKKSSENGGQRRHKKEKRSEGSVKRSSDSKNEKNQSVNSRKNPEKTNFAEPEQNQEQTDAAEPEQNLKQTETVEPEQKFEQTETTEPEQKREQTETVEPEQRMEQTEAAESEQSRKQTKAADSEAGSVQTQDTEFEGSREQENQTDFRDHQENSQEKDEGFRRIFQNIILLIRNICDRIKQLPERIRRAADAVAGVPKKIRRLLMKTDRIRKKPEKFLDMIEEYEILDILKKLKKELVRLLRHYGPRRIQGYLDFGTGDPALTGELTGLLYLVLPAKADDFLIRPDFYEAKLETEFTCTGRIRVIHLISLLLRLLMDQQVRKAIKRVIKKGD
ncbi:MAG: DUF2953 domain-containing protein [Lachnospiraceae bacterium]|nr:DUF2953 domain-containing protein [Lachnospiraceae bacterium]